MKGAGITEGMGIGLSVGNISAVELTVVIGDGMRNLVSIVPFHCSSLRDREACRRKGIVADAHDVTG